MVTLPLFVPAPPLRIRRRLVLSGPGKVSDTVVILIMVMVIVKKMNNFVYSATVSNQKGFLVLSCPKRIVALCRVQWSGFHFSPAVRIHSTESCVVSIVGNGRTGTDSAPARQPPPTTNHSIATPSSEKHSERRTMTKPE